MIPAKWAVFSPGASLGPLLLLVQACSGGGAASSDAGQDTGVGGRTYAPKFSAVYDEILGSCAQSFCHRGVGIAMDLSDQPTAYMQLVNAPASPNFNCAGMGIRVVPMHPETSLMYLKLTQHPPPCGGSMPGVGKAPLTARDIQQIQQWIMMGAKND
jgi:hypothetical protein